MTYYMPSKAKRNIRRDLFACQNGRCAYCNRGLTLEARHYRKANHATLDHLLPLVLGGRSERDNFVLCCRLCNIVKGHSTLEEFVFGLFWIWLYKERPALAFKLHTILAGEAVASPPQ